MGKRWNRLLSYEPDERWRDTLLAKLEDGRITFDEYAQRFRKEWTRHEKLVASPLFVHFMALILPAVDWVQAVWMRARLLTRRIVRRAA